MWAASIVKVQVAAHRTARLANLAAAYLMPLVYLTWSLFYGEKSPDNPWHATGLEWQTPSPPPKSNFLRPPRVDADPYDYHDFGRAEETGDESRARPQGDAL